MKTVLVTGRDRVKFIEEIKKFNLPLEFYLEEEKKDCDIYVGYKALPDFSNYKYEWVHSLGAGVDTFINHSINLLTRTMNQFGESIFNYCLYYINNEYYKNNQIIKKWDQYFLKENIIIYGAGNIGSYMAKRFRELGFNVYGVSRSLKDNPDFNEIYGEKINEGLKKSNWIINVLPLTKETKDYFDITFFRECNGQGFINVGRGMSVIEEDLIKAIDEQKISRAILDVFRTEPLPNYSLLWDKAIITPHIAGITNISSAVLQFVDTYNRIITGEELNNKVDLEREY